MKLSEFFERFVYTRKCVCCGEMMPYEQRTEAFCPFCRAKWDIAKTEECGVCGKAICECTCMTKVLSDAGALCHHKTVVYSSSRAIVHRPLIYIKRNKNPRVAGFFASQIERSLAADEDLPELSADDTVISFVPRSRKAVLKYGFDQSELIARELSRIMGIPFASTVARRRGGKIQKKLNAKERLKNVKKLFVAEKELKDTVADRKVLLVDDIVTTGASMAACTSLLIRNRAKAVICVSVAVTSSPKER